MNGDALSLESQLCFPLYAAARLVTNRYKPFLDAIGLTYTQYITMMVLWEHPGLGMTELGKRLRLDSGTLTPLLKRLEARGLLRRARCEEDERAVRITVTEAGEGLRAQAVGIPAEMAKCMPLSLEEAETLYALLYRLLEGMDDGEAR